MLPSLISNLAFRLDERAGDGASTLPKLIKNRIHLHDQRAGVSISEVKTHVFPNAQRFLFSITAERDEYIVLLTLRREACLQFCMARHNSIRESLMTPSKLRPALLKWQLRQLWLSNIVMLALGVPYVLLTKEPLIPPGNLVALLAIIAHSGIMAACLGRISSPRIGFLYAQGFTRDQIWWHTLLASVVSATLVCGTTWLLMVTGLRAIIQDQYLESPCFPYAARAEGTFPFILLFEYALTIPLVHYSWVRANQPCGDAEAGLTLSIGGICLLLWGYGMALSHSRYPGFLSLVAWSCAPLILLLILVCWRTHRRMEVRS